MAIDVVINGTTYPAVESVALMDVNGNVTQFYSDAVRYVEQNPTEEQKAQARQNIDALGTAQLPEAVNNALAQAKASGEFDGEKGEDGEPGKDGKSAYQYAQDGGYTGTEEEFAAKLAQEPLAGLSTDITPNQVYDAVTSGLDVFIMYTDKTFGLFVFTAFDANLSLQGVFSSTILQYNGMYAVVELIGDLNANTWQFVVQQMATINDIPTKVSQLTNDSEYMTLGGYQVIAPTTLKNPHALTINGVSYDGSAAVNMTEKVNALIDAKLSAITNAEEVSF